MTEDEWIEYTKKRIEYAKKNCSLQEIVRSYASEIENLTFCYDLTDEIEKLLLEILYVGKGIK